MLGVKVWHVLAFWPSTSRAGGAAASDYHAVRVATSDSGSQQSCSRSSASGSVDVEEVEVQDDDDEEEEGEEEDGRFQRQRTDEDDDEEKEVVDEENRDKALKHTSEGVKQKYGRHSRVDSEDEEDGLEHCP